MKGKFNYVRKYNDTRTARPRERGEQKQISLFDNSNPKHESLMKALDGLNTVFGAQKVKIASQDLNHIWKMKRQKLSSRFTTNLNEIITVNCE
jgi:DNA polymerase V